MYEFFMSLSTTELVIGGLIIGAIYRIVELKSEGH